MTDTVSLHSEKCPHKRADNIADDIALVFLNSMLDYVVEKWTTIPTEGDGIILSPEEIEVESTNIGSTLNSEEISEESNKSITNKQPDSNKISEWRLITMSETAIVELKNGCIYEGCISNLMMDGYGIFRWTDGSVYEGNFSQNRIHGIGKMVWPDLSWYEGEFFHNHRQGVGTLSLGYSTISYQGEWLFCQKHGNGCLIYDNDQCYDGNWFKDKYSGTGKRQYGQNTYYYGNWVLGQQNGFGCMIWPNNDHYRGDWENGKMHGYGEYIWDGVANSEFLFPIKNTYKGMWSFGLRHGLGLLIFGYLNGARYEGYFYNGLKHGEGAIVCGNGKVIRRSPLFLYDKPIHLTDDQYYSDPLSRDKMIVYVPNRLIHTKDYSCGCKECQNDTTKVCHKSAVQYYISPIIEIPVHAPCHSIDLSDHLLRLWIQDLIKKETLINVISLSKIFKNTKNRSNVNSVKRGIPPASTYILNIPQDFEKQVKTLAMIFRDPEEITFEEQCTENCLLTNLPRLWDIYRVYCNICVNKHTNHRAILIRLFLWQLYRDCMIITKISLVRIDILLSRNKTSYVETIHYPFEKIYFWQFLHSLVAIAWELYSESSINCPAFPRSLLASVLYKLLHEDIYPHAFNHNGNVLFKYRDIVPIDPMYQYYRSISEPITVKQFLKLAKCNDPPRTERTNNKKYESFNGRNIILYDNNTEFTPEMDELYILNRVAYDSCQDDIDFDALYNSYICCLTKIGLSQMLKCMAQVCPLICVKKGSIKIEYEMTFLEFYEVLIGCMIRYSEICAADFKECVDTPPKTEVSKHKKPRNTKLKSKMSVHKVSSRSGKS